MPGGARDASHEATDESEGEEQLTQPDSPQDKDQHMPGGTGDASCKTTDDSEGKEWLTQPDSPQNDPMEGSALLRQESLGTTSVGGDPPSDSQEEVVMCQPHT